VPPLVFLTVLCAALCNAGWHTIVKSGGDKQLDVVLVSVGAAIVSAIILPFLPAPAEASWPYLLASTPVQVLYYALLTVAYRKGEMSEAYPLMRGTAPLLVATAAGPFVGEMLTLHRFVGIALICSGALLMAVDAHRRRSASGSVLAISLANAAVIALYTVIDGLGVRKSGSPLAYALWIFVLTALPLLLWALLHRARELMAYVRARLYFGCVGGVATLGSYGLTLCAMAVAPVALVAALRETSILFATVMAVFILKERIRWPRYFAIALIAVGAITIRLTS